MILREILHELREIRKELQIIRNEKELHSEIVLDERTISEAVRKSLVFEEKRNKYNL